MTQREVVGRGEKRDKKGTWRRLAGAGRFIAGAKAARGSRGRESPEVAAAGLGRRCRHVQRRASRDK